jgi:malate dehydrogenase (quinone)
MNLPSQAEKHVVLVGSGVMSATMGLLLKELEPTMRITILERLNRISAESSDAWNNAGTGHAAYCELNYTPQKEDGSIDTTKAIKISDSFEKSKELWAYCIKNKYIQSSEDFLKFVPHCSFVTGDKDVAFLKKRYDSLQKSAFFKDMVYTEDLETMKSWFPLIMEGRNRSQKVAATRMDMGMDVNFGALTRAIIGHLDEKTDKVDVFLGIEVQNISQIQGNKWKIDSKDLMDGSKKSFIADFVFIGAGGGTLHLLEKTGIKEVSGYGGFPVGGLWLVCNDDTTIQKHYAKVYGQAKIGAPPMSVPHLDSRNIDGKRALFFGPFASFSTKFLKEGSYLDLLTSITTDNIMSMLGAGWHNMDLTKYLINQLRLSHEERIDTLREFIPTAVSKHWEIMEAGQRVQVIKKDDKHGGTLGFGTEVITTADGTLAGLLGASPGASTAATIILEILEKCFPENYNGRWQEKLTEMIPSLNENLSDDEDLLFNTRRRTHGIIMSK